MAHPAFTRQPLARSPRPQIFLSGAHDFPSYPIRHALFEYQTQHPNQVVAHQHPGYGQQPKNQSEVYAKEMASYVAGITTTMLHRRLVAKTFEIPATGSLLIINQDLQPLLQQLGFRDRVHYLSYPNTDFQTAINWVLDPFNAKKVDAMRRAGRALIHTHHSTSARATALAAFVQFGIVSYPIVSLKTPDPCPMKGYESVKDCRSFFRNHIQFHEFRE